MSKKRVFSGIQPSGDLHIGNYLATIYKWVKEQDEKDNIFCVMDLHAITVPQDPVLLKQRTIEIAKIYLASGIDPKKSTVFVQSSRPEHTELGWILNCQTNLGPLFRMHQFKEKADVDIEGYDAELQSAIKSLRQSKEVKKALTDLEKTMDHDTYSRFITEQSAKSALEAARKYFEILMSKIQKANVGLLDYPILMAADILLYDTDEVPVGEDQKQHVEICRDIAERVNKRFGKDVFQVPEFTTNKAATRIMSLTDPTVKMSKSDENPKSRIEILDTPDVIRKKLASAVTDSGNEVRFDKENKPGISNLLNILSVCTETPVESLEKKYIGESYGEFKKDVAEAVINLLEPFQKKYSEISDEYVVKILEEGAERVKPVAKKVLKRVKDAVGLGI